MMTFEQAEAERIARKTLENVDWSLDWRDAGYTSAEAAAEVLIGDRAAEPEVLRLAISMVADRIRVPEVDGRD